ncbi:hypothetical protein J2T14_002402 [Paenibacillus harenae]|nr:hypothetical protein [Paenibacillus harenae]
MEAQTAPDPSEQLVELTVVILVLKLSNKQVNCYTGIWKMSLKMVSFGKRKGGYHVFCKSVAMVF